MTVPLLASARFAQGEDVTVLGTGKADPAYCGNVPVSMGVRLPGGRMLVAGPGWPGITLIHGDILPTLIQALRDAVEFHDHGECGDVGHLGWVDQYYNALDVLGAEPP